MTATSSSASACWTSDCWPATRSCTRKLVASLPRFFHGRREELIRHLSRLTRVRHARYSNTIYHMEPNVKETPGGLRDFQLVRWLSQLRSAQPYQMPAPDPFAELEPARAFLSTLRCYLHYKAGRDSNLLSFDAQEEITEQPFIHHRDAAAWMRRVLSPRARHSPLRHPVDGGSPRPTAARC